MLHEADPKKDLFPAILDREDKVLTAGGSEINSARVISFVLSEQGLKNLVTFCGGAGDD